MYFKLGAVNLRSDGSMETRNSQGTPVIFNLSRDQVLEILKSCPLRYANDCDRAYETVYYEPNKHQYIETLKKRRLNGSEIVRNAFYCSHTATLYVCNDTPAPTLNINL